MSWCNTRLLTQARRPSALCWPHLYRLFCCFVFVDACRRSLHHALGLLVVVLRVRLFFTFISIINRQYNILDNA